MPGRRLRQLYQEARQELSADPRRFFGLCALAALVMLSYGLVRPPIESLFLERYTSAGLPWVWLAVAIGAVVVTLFYNQFARTVRITEVCTWVALASAVLLVVLLVALVLDAPHAIFILYIWKDVYIVVLVEVFWSFANIVHPVRTARWTYGVFLVSGSLGSMVGEIGVIPAARSLGSAAIPWLSVPVLVAVAVLVRRFSVPDAEARLDRPPLGTELWRGIATVWRSRYLGLLVLLIGFVQVAITIIDYQFNAALEVSYPLVDERTAVSGAIYATISAASIVLQALAGPIFALAGVPLVLVAIPLLLGAPVAWLAAAPQFASAALAKVTGKSLDYSLGRAAKEILYIPLSYSEKTQGKAFADIFSYRVAKAAASLLLGLAAQSLGGQAVSWICASCVAVWVLLAGVIARRFAGEPSTDSIRASPENAPGPGAPPRS